MNADNPWYSEIVQSVPYERIAEFYRHVQSQGEAAIRWLVLRDRYFLLTCVMGRADAANRWCFDRCREVEREPDGILDLWSRYHYKSTIITLAGSVQEILRDPEITIAVISYNNATAQDFVDQIRRELESETLKRLFPTVLLEKPPTLNWSVQKGLTVQRKSNPKEPTVCGFGLIDGQKTGGHYRLRIYDDIVVPASVSTPEQIKKTTQYWEQSLALTTTTGGRAWYAGTRYHQADTYGEMLRRGSVTERRRVCVDKDGNPLLMSREDLEERRRDMSVATWSAQMMQEPISGDTRTFKDEWWNVYLRRPERSTMRRAILVDSAKAKGKRNDYTTMWVVGWARDKNYYLLDGIHDRLDLSERTDALFDLVQLWEPERVFWEQIGAMSDVQHVLFEQDQRGWHFSIKEIGQKVAKNDRIEWLEPICRTGRLWVPAQMLRRQRDGETRDLMRDLYDDEFVAHPICRHDDMLDDLANIKHPTVTALIDFPRSDDPQETFTPRHVSGKPNCWDPTARYA